MAATEEETTAMGTRHRRDLPWYGLYTLPESFKLDVTVPTVANAVSSHSPSASTKS